MNKHKMNQLKFLTVFVFLSSSFNFGQSKNGFVLGSGASHAEIVGGARSVAMSSAELADGLLQDDYDSLIDEEEWEDPAMNFKAGKKKQKQKMTTASEVDKDSVFQQGETRDFLHFLRRIKYDHRQCPDDDGSVVIDVSIVVSNIRAVSEVTMDYALEMFYRESWTDTRLNYDKALFRNKTEISLHESYTNMLWHPDTFMPNAIASKNPQKQSISHRSLLRLQEHGRILYSRRISVVAECPMDLVLFPFDTQICKLGIESYGYTADQVVYQWSKGQISALTLSKIRLPDFQIKEAYVVSQIESYATGDYSRLYVCFVFTRASGFCFLQLIIPSTAVVITSWVTLWLEKETEFQDMISIILAITFLIFSYNEMMPRVSYLKALDIWLAVCFLIVFMSLIKLALVKYMRQKLNSQSRRYRENSMVANILPIIRANSVAGVVAPVENGNLTPIFIDQENNNGNSIPPPNNVLTSSTTTLTRPFRSCSIQYTSVPLGPECTEMTKDHGVHLFTKCSTGLMRFLPSCRFTSTTMRRFHWITQMAFFFGFIIFAMFYFLAYPNIHFTPIDPACDREKAEFFAIIL